MIFEPQCDIMAKCEAHAEMGLIRLILFRNARVLTPNAEMEGCVLVDGEQIVSVGWHIDPPEGTRVIDARGFYLSPGFIDLHVHGGGGYGVMDATADAIVGMANAHAHHGTTTLLPTTMSAPLPMIRAAGQAITDAMVRNDCLATIAGAHFEGPCLSPAQAGAQPKEALLTPVDLHLASLLNDTPQLRMMGAAPELEGAFPLGEALAAHGIVASIAHSDATYAQVEDAVRHGYSDVTHLYSGCSTVRRIKAFRVPGVVEAGLNLETLTVQVIADGRHLPAELVSLIYRCKGAERMYLITDGLELSATQTGEGTVYTNRSGVTAIYEDGVMKLLDRSAFAGSVATMARLVRIAYDAGIPLRDVVRMATETPAKRIGLHRKGCIAPGYDADIVLFDGEIRVRMVYARGRMIEEDAIFG